MGAVDEICLPIWGSQTGSLVCEVSRAMEQLSLCALEPCSPTSEEVALSLATRERSCIATKTQRNQKQITKTFLKRNQKVVKSLFF